MEPSAGLEEDKNKLVQEGGAVGVVSIVIIAFGDIRKGDFSVCVLVHML